MRAAADHHIGIAAAEDFGGLADGLRAGGAGGQAVERRAAGAGEQGQMRQRHVRLLLELAGDVHAFERRARPISTVSTSAVSFSTPERAAVV